MSLVPDSPDRRLLAIPVPFLVAGLLGTVLSVPFALIAAAGAVPAGCLVGYALFVDPPTG